MIFKKNKVIATIFNFIWTLIGECFQGLYVESSIFKRFHVMKDHYFAQMSYYGCFTCLLGHFYDLIYLNNYYLITIMRLDNNNLHILSQEHCDSFKFILIYCDIIV
jgi:hypothetical protein